MIVDIRADQTRLRGAQPEPSLDEAEPMLPPLPDFDLGDGIAVRPPTRGWGGVVAAVALCVAWIGAIGWLASTAQTTSAFPAGWLASIPALAIGPVLIALAWLLLLRTSRAEARRFGHAAEAMHAEAARLERSVAAITRSLDGNRLELAQQLDQLAGLGEAAAERLAAIGRGIAADIAQADEHARRLALAADGAQARVETLVTALPLARSETEALTEALDGSGQVAARSVDDLAARLLALAEQGRAAESATVAAAGVLAEHVTRIDAVSDGAAQRLAAATAATATTVDALLVRTADTVDAARRGIDSQGEAMIAMVASHHARLDTAARDSAEALAARIEGIDGSVDRLADRLEQQRVAGDALIAGLESGVVRVAGRMDVLHEQGVERSQLLAASISALGGSADAMTEALRAGESMATRTIGTTESLLIALDAAAREIDETLPDALTRLDARIVQSKSIVVQAKPELLALVTAAESTHDAIEAIAGVIHDQRRTLDQLTGNLIETLTSGSAKADALGQMVDETIGRSHRFAEEAAPRLIEALLRVRETAASAADHARATLAGVIPEAAETMRAAAGDALRGAAADTVRRQIDAIAEATDSAVDAAARATERLAAQVRDITEQTAIVETHLETARTEREAADHDTLSRRVSQLIESLNSAAIDITRSIAPEVSDSAWAAYLKGDRGVFTRRAVRLLDAGQARDIARLYDDDPRFRDQVNRYIHDFEGMLRGVLAQRDGSPLGVTLLSSDMGKLYVALAQAIERLR